MGLRNAQAMAPPVVLTMSKYMFMQKGAEDETNDYAQSCRYVRYLHKYFKAKCQGQWMKDDADLR